MNNKDVMYGELAMLIGGKITHVVKSHEEIGTVYGLQIEFKDKSKKIIFILSDFEGNAPGAWEINDEGWK